MIKVRLHGTPEEIKEFAEYLDNAPRIKVLQRSEEYSDRGKSSYKRVYIDVTLTPYDKGQVTAVVYRDGKVIKHCQSSMVGVFGLLEGGLFTGDHVDGADMILYAARLQVFVDRLTKQLAGDKHMPLEIMKEIISDACKEMTCIYIPTQKKGDER
ncbi:MAG: hypothetical protein NC311_14480 [Muribaculaceae bacterium]|nr:hypothetical protein [Muribaculaceae bacterium]